MSFYSLIKLGDTHNSLGPRPSQKSKRGKSWTGLRRGAWDGPARLGARLGALRAVRVEPGAG